MMEKLRSTLGFGNILSKDDIALFSAAFQERKLQAADYLKHSGAKSTEIAFIHEGILRIFKTIETGNEVTKYFLRAGQFAAELEGYYSGLPTDDAIQAVTDATIYVIKKSSIEQLSQQIPPLYLFLKSITESALLNKLKDNDFLNYGNAETKYHEFVKRYPDLAFLVPQQMIASYLKITPQSLSRIRKSR